MRKEKKHNFYNFNSFETSLFLDHDKNYLKTENVEKFETHLISLRS